MKIGPWWVGHPPYEELGRFADDALTGRARARVGGHLGSCDRCRRELGTLRDAEAALRNVPVPAPPADLFERILAQRGEGGVHPLLPPDPPMRRPGRHVVPAALTIVLAAIGSSLLLNPPDAGAGTSELNVAWGSDRTTVSLSYRPTVELARQDTLVARASIWTRGSRMPREWVSADARLRREGDVFVGEMSVPADLTYGLVAVERTVGDFVDLNGGAYWEITEPSTPSPDGYLGRFLALRALFENDVWVGGGELSELAREASIRFPEDPRVRREEWFWTTRTLPGGPDLADLSAEHRRVLARLDTARVAWTVEQTAALAAWASALDEPEIADRWYERLEARAPDHWLVASRRIVRALFAGDATTEAGTSTLVNALERAWVGSEAARAWVRSFVPQLILDAGAPLEPDLRRTWVERAYRDAGLEQRVLTLRPALEDPQLGPWAVSMARPLLAELASPPPSRRPFFQTVDEYRAQRLRWAAELQGQMGRALLAAGDSAAALENLESLLRSRWDPDAARLALALLPDATATSLELAPQGARTVEAATAGDRLARLLAIDPLQAGDDTLDVDYALARNELLSLIDGEGPGARLGTNDLRFDRLDGSARSLDPGGRAVLLLWSVVPSAAQDTLDNEFGALRRRLARDRVPLIIVGEPGAEADLSRVAVATGADVLIDRRRTARRAFPVWGSPAEIVMDDGRFWEARSPEDAVRIALLLPARATVAEE